MARSAMQSPILQQRQFHEMLGFLVRIDEPHVQEVVAASQLGASAVEILVNINKCDRAWAKKWLAFVEQRSNFASFELNRLFMAYDEAAMPKEKLYVYLDNDAVKQAIFGLAGMIAERSIHLPE